MKAVIISSLLLFSMCYVDCEATLSRRRTNSSPVGGFEFGRTTKELERLLYGDQRLLYGDDWGIESLSFSMSLSFTPNQGTTPSPTRSRRPPTNPPTRPPAREPTRRPEREPTRRPEREPTRRPVEDPTRRPEPEPTRRPVEDPTRRPEPEPTQRPDREPTRRPDREPTQRPDREPTRSPVEQPTQRPVEEPTRRQEPTRRPVEDPTQRPVDEPTRRPVQEPTRRPVDEPTRRPVQERVESKAVCESTSCRCPETSGSDTNDSTNPKTDFFVNFSYSAETTTRSENFTDSVESLVFDSVSGELLECPDAGRVLRFGRRLNVVAVDAAPGDTVDRDGNCAFDDSPAICYVVSGTMTFTMDDDSTARVIDVFETTVHDKMNDGTYADQVDGVVRLKYMDAEVGSNLIQPKSAVSEESNTENVSGRNTVGIILGSFAGAAFVAALVFVERRRRSNQRSNNNEKKPDAVDDGSSDGTHSSGPSSGLSPSLAHTAGDNSEIPDWSRETLSNVSLDESLVSSSSGTLDPVPETAEDQGWW